VRWANRVPQPRARALAAAVVDQVTKSPLMTELLPMFRRSEHFRAISLIVAHLSRALESQWSLGDRVT
jgi:hypothetical protein